MKVMKPVFLLLALCLTIPIVAQETNAYPYNISPDNPYGKINPDAPSQLADFAPLIGQCECLSQNRNSDGSWAEPIDMTWTFKYIMNGMAIQDETSKADGTHSGSIRQFNADSLKWYVHYYTTKSIPSTLSSWEGVKEGDKIVLYRPQKAPNGMEGSSRLTFYDMNETGFRWIGEWINEGASIVYPFWKIECKKGDKE